MYDPYSKSSVQESVRLANDIVVMQVDVVTERDKRATSVKLSL